MLVVLTMYLGLVTFAVNSVDELHGFSPQNISSPKPMEGKLRTKRHVNSYYGEYKKDFSDSPYPPQNYGQYNSPITQKDFSQKDFLPQGNTNNIFTRDIQIKQGRLRGLVREFKNRGLKNVEMYLGIPYAAPPVGAMRFMPPGSPPSWKNVQVFDRFSPVCPQTPPDITREPLSTMTAGRFNHLKGLLPYLRNQSEDCLYLNIYAPIKESGLNQLHPVIVYVHGESYEWNSGNPYDGSVLASHGRVVVVTINFRLGILGFLRPGTTRQTVSNFGLLDQIAALQWVKDNIEAFGGDPTSVTLMGHGTGAACINFLMVSPVSRASDGLFHKAILMSGTALSDWALTENPLQFTIQVAEALNCPLVDKNDELPNCLRKKRLSEIMSVKVNVPEFQTPFGPLIDGSVVPNTPDLVMGMYNKLFTSYDLLYGMTEWESYHSLNALSLTYGMLESERDDLLRKFMHSKYEKFPELALTTTLSEYKDWKGQITFKPAAEEHRDLILDVLSDARVAAPMIQMAMYHSRVHPKSYLYVFKHNSQYGEFAGSDRSISGEEIAYVFGAALTNGEESLFHHTFSKPEQQLSEAILTYFTNFAKTGNPNSPERRDYLTVGRPRDWLQYDVEWPEFDQKNQSYLALDIKPYVSHYYRNEKINYWNGILPGKLANPTLGSNKVKQPRVKEHPPEDETYYSGLKPPFPPFFKHPKSSGSPTSWTYGNVISSPDERNRDIFLSERGKSAAAGRGQMDRPVEQTTEYPGRKDGDVTGSTILTILTFFGVCIFVINIFAFTLLYYKRQRLKLEETRLNQLSNVLEDDDDDGGFKERQETRNRGCNGGIYDIITGGSKKGGETAHRSEEMYEAVQTRSKDRSRKFSTSTVDPHTKVREWIQNEIIEKYSPSILRRANRQIYQEESQSNSEGFVRNDDIFEPKPKIVKPILKTQKSLDTARSAAEYPANRRPAQHRNVEKVSIGIDATPSTRSASVLKQTPIEITKSLEEGLLCATRFQKECCSEDDSSLKRSRTSVSLQILPGQSDEDEEKPQNVTPLEPTVIKIHHSHSKSDPVEKSFQTFNGTKDVNVTSKDSEIILQPENLPRDTLKNIQKRNFPKVLPDLPEPLKSCTNKRLSLPPSSSRLMFSSASYDDDYDNNDEAKPSDRNKVPPRPPPRVSTLDRRHRGKLKQDDQEPKIVASTAVINFKTPIIPKKSPEKSVPSAVEDTKGHHKKPSETQTHKSVPQTIIKASGQHSSMTIKRQGPNVIIQSVTGPPKKEENKSKTQQSKTPRVNLQTEVVTESRGKPQDKIQSEQSAKSLAQEVPTKSLITTNAVEQEVPADISSSSSSSSIAKESSGTVRRAKRPTKDAAV